jgi:hypothetical protein
MAPNKGTEVESHLVLEAGPDMSPIQRWWLGGRLQPVCRSISTVSIGCAIYHNYYTLRSVQVSSRMALRAPELATLSTILSGMTVIRI